MAEKVTANIGFEKQIWDAACALRGSMDASEYKHVILGLIFLKYISDRFEDKYKELKTEGDGFEEDVDEYTECQHRYHYRHDWQGHEVATELEETVLSAEFTCE